MKFQQLSTFEKHLEKAAVHHLSRVYQVIASCSFERKKISSTICAVIQKKEGSIAKVSFDGKELEWAKVRQELDTASFLEGCRIVIVDEADKLSKTILFALSAYIVKPSPFAYLILSSASAKNLGELYEQGKKELVVCDLSAEKPWERKERLRAQLIKSAALEGKTLVREAADLLLERTGGELPLLEQELNKLICYCQERPQIALQDVQLLCSCEKATSLWNLAESIVWQKCPVSVDVGFDLSSLLVVLGQVRSHLQQGAQLSKQLEEGRALRDISLPFFKPQLLEKAAPIAKSRTPVFFTRALVALFDVEMLAKGSSLTPSLLLDLLVAKVAHLK
ncbi:MAG TPA: hypothetical protein VGJ00_08050 [Rhabdochlamydiaceae bacterium]|jgi:DNA polymerase-3 subunit delta